MIAPFDLDPDFYLTDNRFHRAIAPINKVTLNARHSVMLPEWLIKDKSVLDLGSCLGATGAWCLSLGAKSYTGVEIQSEYLEQSQKLLARHWPADKFTLVRAEIADFLCEADAKSYDVIVMAGVIYSYVDYFSVLENAARVAASSIIIESLYPQVEGDHPGFIQILPYQTMTLPGAAERAVGTGSRLSPSALNLLMRHFGYENPDGLLLPAQVSGMHDAFHEILPNLKKPMRFIARYKRKKDAANLDLAASLKQDSATIPKMDFGKYRPGEKAQVGSWKFNAQVAEKFDDIARTSIPGYRSVIEKCVRLATKIFPQKLCRVIDVGSATGFTVEEFVKAGFKDTWGVESSSAMLEVTRMRTKIIFSEHFPAQLGGFDFVCANWVLHFMPFRENYLQEIFAGMNKNGLIVLSEKVRASQLAKDLYWDFKRENGLGETEIMEKDAAIEGILVPYPLEWYLTTLAEIGFVDIEVVAGEFHFVTLIARKP